MPAHIDDYEAMLTAGPLWQERLEGIGKLTREEVINMGLTGPMLRGSGVDWDLRRDMPYGGYENYDFKVPVATEGDCYARYLVRMEEMRQSVRIIEQAIKNLPDGLYRTDDRKVSLPPRAELDVSMEALIHHFKLMTEGFLVPPGMVYHGHRSQQGRAGLLRLQRRLGRALPPACARAELQQPLCHQQDEQRRHALRHRDQHRLHRHCVGRSRPLSR